MHPESQPLNESFTVARAICTGDTLTDIGCVPCASSESGLVPWEWELGPVNSHPLPPQSLPALLPLPRTSFHLPQTVILAPSSSTSSNATSFLKLPVAQPFIHSLHKYLLSSCMPGTVLGTWDLSVSKTKAPAPLELTFRWEGEYRKQ